MKHKVGIFLDGTGNHRVNDVRSEDGSLTNVAKLHDAFEGQVRIYEPGVGTRKLSPEEMALVKSGQAEKTDLYKQDGNGLWSDNNALKLGTAYDTSGENQVIAQANAAMVKLEKYIANNPNVEIEVDMFGFSRGAAATRHLANEIADLQQAHPNVSINFIGLYDTVAAIGLANHDNGDLRLDLPVDITNKVYQQVAAHENRESYTSESIKFEDGTSPPNFEEKVAAGAHADMGNGYKHKETEWLLKDTGTFTYHDEQSKNERLAAVEAEAIEQGLEVLVTHDAVPMGNDMNYQLRYELVEKREITNELGDVHLKDMKAEAEEAGVSFKAGAGSESVVIPSDLEGYYQQLRAGDVNAANNEQVKPYIHQSHSEGKANQSFSERFANNLNEEGREVFYNQQEHIEGILSGEPEDFYNSYIGDVLRLRALDTYAEVNASILDYVTNGNIGISSEFNYDDLSGSSNNYVFSFNDNAGLQKLKEDKNELLAKALESIQIQETANERLAQEKAQEAYDSASDPVTTIFAGADGQLYVVDTNDEIREVGDEEGQIPLAEAEAIIASRQEEPLDPFGGEGDYVDTGINDTMTEEEDLFEQPVEPTDTTSTEDPLDAFGGSGPDYSTDSTATDTTSTDSTDTTNSTDEIDWSGYDDVMWPVAMDLDGDGVELTALATSPTFYDLHGDGYQYQLGWVASDDGLLALDLDGDQIIDKANEISFISYVDGAKTDLEGLAYFDTNGDGQLSHLDAQWSQFGVWQDADQDGNTDYGEFTSLVDTGISSISLTSDQISYDLSSNKVAGTGSYARADGSAGVLADVGLQTANYGIDLLAGPESGGTGGFSLKNHSGSQLWLDDPQINANVSSEDNRYTAWLGNDGDDAIAISHAQDVLLSGGEGNDTLTGGAGNDVLLGDGGVDGLEGGAGSDVLLFDVADTHIDGGEGYDVGLLLTDNNEAINLDLTASSLEAVYTQGGDDKISAAGKADGVYVQVAGGNDVVTGGLAADQLYGGVGNDTLDGEDGNDQLFGGAGNDRMTGGQGSDYYYWNLGDGHDVINDYNAQDAIDSTHVDRVIIGAGIAADDISWSRTETDLVASVTQINGETQSLTFQNWYLGEAYQPEEVRLASGQMLPMQALAVAFVGTALADSLQGGEQHEHLQGLEGDDQLDGGPGNDQLTGGAGNDYLAGGQHNDVYHWGIGDGDDVIDDYDVLGRAWDVLQFGEGVSAEMLMTSRVDDNLLITIDAGNESNVITLKDWYTSEHHRLEEVILFDGSVVEVANMPLITVGTQGDDWMPGSFSSETLLGGEGNDYLDGSWGNDVLVGGPGQDQLLGGPGNDTYVWNLGDGHDRIRNINPSYQSASIDTLNLGEGITAEDITFSRTHSDLILAVSKAGFEPQSLTLEEWFTNEDSRIDTVNLFTGEELDTSNLTLVIKGTEFDDSLIGYETGERFEGLAGNDMIMAEAGNDVLIGGPGDDYLDGGPGADVFHWGLGDGNDRLNMDDRQYVNFDLKSSDTVILGEGITSDNIVWDRFGNDLLMTTANTDGQMQTLTLANWFGGTTFQPQAIQLADGQLLDLDNISFPLRGTELGDHLFGSSKGERIYGLGGNDYIWAAGGDDYIDAGTGDDHVYADDGDDILIGGEGNDFLQGMMGNDTYLWSIGDGNDVIDEMDPNNGIGENTIDTLAIGDGVYEHNVTFVRDGQNLKMLIQPDIGDQAEITLQYWFGGEAFRPEVIRLANSQQLHINELDFPIFGTYRSEYLSGSGGAELIYGLAGNDTIYGRYGDDHLVGGEGDDDLFGGQGNDTYYWSFGDGNDRINNSDYQDSMDPTSRDVLQFGEGITASDISFTMANYDLLVDVQQPDGSLSQVTLNSWYIDPDYRLDAMVLDSGEELDLSALKLTVSGTEFDDELHGSNLSDTLLGFGGNDVLYGHDSGDELIGGTGDDLLIGGQGLDTYVWGRGDGNDRIDDYAVGDRFGNHPDTIVFGEGISAGDIHWHRDSADLFATVDNPDGSSQTLTIQGWYMDYANRPSLYQLHNNQLLDQNNITIHYNGSNWHDYLQGSFQNEYISGLGGDDEVHANNGADVVKGGSGNDHLYGGPGDDWLAGGQGDDLLKGDGDSDTYYWGIGDGNDTIENYSDWDNWMPNHRDVVQLGDGIMLLGVVRLMT